MAPKKQANKEQQVPEAQIEVVDTSWLGDISPTKRAAFKEIAVCVRAQLQNWRQGTVACKSRGEVAFSNRKPWKQKGTGRARAGSLRSPLWRKGGVIFGPQARTRVLKVAKKVKTKALKALAWNYITQKRVIALPWALEGDRPKTAYAFNLLKDASLHDRKINIFVSSTDMLARSSFANLANVRVMFFDQPTVYELLDSEYWVILKKDTDLFKEMVLRWS